MRKLEVMIPVRNEEICLQDSIERLMVFMLDHMNEYDWSVLIIDNGSTDNTQQIGHALANVFPYVTYAYTGKMGVGSAIKYGITMTTVDILAIMDVDLMDSLEALLPMVRKIDTGMDLVACSKFHPESTIQGRPAIRTVMSHVNSMVLRTVFPGFPLTDSQCGFKVFSRRMMENIIPKAIDDYYFFHTELSVLAWKYGYNIIGYPIYLIDNMRPSKVSLIRDTLRIMMGYARLRLQLILHK